MADIKFMDISENDNPATTDSILVGNADNGVKRTTLGKLGDMFAVHGLFHFEKVQDPLQKQVVQYGITAPTVPNYQFAFWLSALAVNWEGDVHVDQPTNPNASIWISTSNPATDIDPFVNGSNAVSAYAVYVKSSVA